VLTVGVPARGVRPNPVSMVRKKPHNTAPSGLAGGTGAFNPNTDSAPANRPTTGFAATARGAAAIAGVTGTARAVAEIRVVAAEGAEGERVSVESMLALLPVDPVLPVGRVVVTAEAASSRTPCSVVSVLAWLPVLPEPEPVLAAGRVRGLTVALVVDVPAAAAAVELTRRPVEPAGAILPDRLLDAELSPTDDAELLALLGGEELFGAAPSAWAIPDPLASAAPTPRVIAPAPSQAYGLRRRWETRRRLFVRRVVRWCINTAPILSTVSADHFTKESAAHK